MGQLLEDRIASNLALHFIISLSAFSSPQKASVAENRSPTRLICQRVELWNRKATGNLLREPIGKKPEG